MVTHPLLFYSRFHVLPTMLLLFIYFLVLSVSWTTVPLVSVDTSGRLAFPCFDSDTGLVVR